MKRSNPRQRNREGETGQLVLRAAEAHHEAELARRQVRLAKAEYKKARKAFKKLKKAARQARKLAKAANKVLKAQANERAAKRRQPRRAQLVRPVQSKKKAVRPVAPTTPSVAGTASPALPGTESKAAPNDISPPAAA